MKKKIVFASIISALALGISGCGEVREEAPKATENEEVPAQEDKQEEPVGELQASEDIVLEVALI